MYARLANRRRPTGKTKLGCDKASVLISEVSKSKLDILP